jgi:hypothetical protein
VGPGLGPGGVGVGSGDVAQPLRVALAAGHQVVGRGGGRRHDHGGLVGGVRQQLARLVGGIGAQPFGLGEGALQPAGRLFQGVRPPAYGLLLEPAGLGVPAGHVVVQALCLGAQLGGCGLLGGDLLLGLRAEPVSLGLGGVEQPPGALGERLLGVGPVVLHGYASCQNQPAPVRPGPPCLAGA